MSSWGQMALVWTVVCLPAGETAPRVSLLPEEQLQPADSVHGAGPATVDC